MLRWHHVHPPHLIPEQIYPSYWMTHHLLHHLLFPWLPDVLVAAAPTMATVAHQLSARAAADCLFADLAVHACDLQLGRLMIQAAPISIGMGPRDATVSQYARGLGCTSPSR